VDRAAFADERAPAFRQYVVHVRDDPPPALDVLAVIALVRGIELEGDGRGKFYRHRPDPNRQVHRLQGGHQLSIEIGDGSRRQGQRAPDGVGRLDDELMIDEIERHGERA
jgi:hypothetical protein